MFPMRLALTVFVLALVCIDLVSAQVIFAEHKMRALKGVRDVVLLTQPRTQDTEDPLPAKVLDDLARKCFAGHGPELHTESSNWLLVTFIVTPSGGYLELSLRRWVRILESGEEVLVPVWDDKVLLTGGFTEESFREQLQELLARFLADHIRANP